MDSNQLNQPTLGSEIIKHFTAEIQDQYKFNNDIK